MGDPTHGDEIHAGLGHRADGLQRDPTGGFELDPPAGDLDGPPHLEPLAPPDHLVDGDLRELRRRLGGGEELVAVLRLDLLSELDDDTEVRFR